MAILPIAMLWLCYGFTMALLTMAPLTIASTAQAIATPLDVARVRIMTSDATGVVDTMRDIADNEGGGALYAGIAPKVVRAIASGAIQFSTYEATKEWSLNFLARRFPGL